MVKKIIWIFGGLGLVALGIGILAAPAIWEGPVLLPIGRGHGLSFLDLVGVIPILAGTGWLYIELWQRRQRLFESLQKSPQRGSLAMLIAGFGLGLLLASSFSSFYWWWAIGALLFGGMLLVALKVAA